ncbi:MAG: serine/threonine-protein phosphatase [Pseudobutyrivibrio sp.]|nr:serine/threonine-protein phosphatase [Pseudobutyrivibrio sp.]
MSFKVDAYSDIGTKKNVNQDALLIKQATVKTIGNVCLGVLCDGMGGLSCGEVASAAFIDRMDSWFKGEFPKLLETLGENVDLELLIEKVKNQWNDITTEINDKLKSYGIEKGIRLGTTVVAIIIIGNKYLVMNVGDSRAYKFYKKKIEQVSHDQSYVQQQLELGRMTEEEAKHSDKKSVLLQSIGASEHVVPECFYGETERGWHFLLCSDGLWRKLTHKEIIGITPQKDGIKRLTDLVKNRGETDNISGLIISI